MSNVIPLPPRVTLVPLRAFCAERGVGRTVAVLFHVAVYRGQHPVQDEAQDSGDQQAKQAVGEAE